MFKMQKMQIIEPRKYGNMINPHLAVLLVHVCHRLIFPRVPSCVTCHFLLDGESLLETVHISLSSTRASAALSFLNRIDPDDSNRCLMEPSRLENTCAAPFWKHVLDPLSPPRFTTLGWGWRWGTDDGPG